MKPSKLSKLPKQPNSLKQITERQLKEKENELLQKCKELLEVADSLAESINEKEVDLERMQHLAGRYNELYHEFLPQYEQQCSEIFPSGYPAVISGAIQDLQQKQEKHLTDLKKEFKPLRQRKVIKKYNLYGISILLEIYEKLHIYPSEILIPKLTTDCVRKMLSEYEKIKKTKKIEKIDDFLENISKINQMFGLIGIHPPEQLREGYEILVKTIEQKKIAMNPESSLLTVEHYYTPLMHAVVSGRIDAVEKIAEQCNVDDINKDISELQVEPKTKEKLTAINLATESYNKDIIVLLINEGAKINRKDAFNIIKNNNTKFFKKLLQEIKLEESGFYHLLAVILEEGRRNVDYAKILFQKYHENSKNLSDESKLIIVKLGYKKLFEILDEYCFSILEFCSKSIPELIYPEANALHYACKENKVELCQYLVSKKIDVNIQDGNGCTALHHAVASDSSKTFKIVIRNSSVKLDIEERNGQTVRDYVNKKLEYYYHNVSVKEIAEALANYEPKPSAASKPATISVAQSSVPIAPSVAKSSASTAPSVVKPSNSNHPATPVTPKITNPNPLSGTYYPQPSSENSSDMEKKRKLDMKSKFIISAVILSGLTFMASCVGLMPTKTFSNMFARHKLNGLSKHGGKISALVGGVSAAILLASLYSLYTAQDTKKITGVNK